MGVRRGGPPRISGRAGKQSAARLVASVRAGRRQRRHDLEILARRRVLEAADLREPAQQLRVRTLRVEGDEERGAVLDDVPAGRDGAERERSV